MAKADEWDAATAQRDAAALIALAGAAWPARVAELQRMAERSDRVAKSVAQRHAGEVAMERLRRGARPTQADQAVAALLAEARLARRSLDPAGRARLASAVRRGLVDDGSLTGVFHVLHIAAQHRARGYSIAYTGFADGTAHDLLICRDGITAEIACDTISAEEGRDVHRGAWMRLVDALDPDLQTWLAAHPGRYLLKLTLPQGLRGEEATLASLQARIRSLLAERRRADQDEAAILRLDPLMLAAAQLGPGGTGLMGRLRHEFGHEAHLAVMEAGGGVCVLAARAGRADEVAPAITRRMEKIAPERLSGTRPGILAMLVEDTDPREWRHLREALELEGASRKFLTDPAARHIVAVTCASRQELFDPAAPAEEPTGLRFRNPGHPAARSPALAAAVLSTA